MLYAQLLTHVDYKIITLTLNMLHHYENYFIIAYLSKQKIYKGLIM